jgi:hypothetical protein
MSTPFTPTPDLAAILNHLLDIYERRDGAPKQAVRVRLTDLVKALPGYHSQLDPLPRLTTNEQLTHLAQHGYVALTWQPGQTNHLLETVTLEPSQTAPLYTLLARQPLAEQRQHLREILLAERTHLTGWRRKALEQALTQLKDHKSPSPFSLTNLDWNRDLLTILLHLPDEATATEIPYRVFSVRIFNDSKRFEPLKDTVARLARRHNPHWRDLTPPEVLREVGLVANPGHLYLSGPWKLVDGEGQVTSLAEFYPSVGIPAALAAQVRQVRTEAARVICVENLASFYELIRHEGPGLAALCLWGNPSPATRHLLRSLVDTLPEQTPLLVWADIDYGGLNILAHLRREVSPRFRPYRMDQTTLEAHAHWAQPLTPADERNLTRLRQHPRLSDMRALIDLMLLKGIKLEQEAVTFSETCLTLTAPTAP